MNLEINRESKTPVYLQIKNQIRSLIISDTIPVNYRLPAERKLSESLGVNRSTVKKAYEELKSEGLVDSYIGKGTVVLPKVGKDKNTSAAYIPTIRWKQLENRQLVQNNDPLIRKIVSGFDKDNSISFAAGVPSKEAYPLEVFQKLTMEMTKKHESVFFSPAGVEGCLFLRSGIRDLLRNKGICTLSKDIFVTSGSQQGIDFFARLFIEPGDVVIVEEPTYPGAIQTFELYGVRLIGIPMEYDGMDMSILETCLLKYRPKFIYTQPTFQNPSGITMSIEKRKQLLNLAYQYQVPILEDDPYSELRFDGDFIPSLKAMDESDYVIYLSTFSKTLSFNLRIGFLVANEYIINRLIGLKQLSDIQCNLQAQLLVGDFINEGYYYNHVSSTIKTYKQKRDLMINEMRRNDIQDLELIIPNGGYFIWCKLSNRVRLTDLMENAAKNGIIIMPGDAFYPGGTSGETYIRLTYSYPAEDEIVEGVSRLKRAIDQSVVNKSYRGRYTSTVNPLL